MFKQTYDKGLSQSTPKVVVFTRYGEREMVVGLDEKTPVDKKRLLIFTNMSY